MQAPVRASIGRLSAVICTGQVRETAVTQPTSHYPLLIAALIACATSVSACAESLRLTQVRPLSSELDTGDNVPMRVIFHDGSHPPVSVPMTPRKNDDTLDTADIDAASTDSPSHGGASEPIAPYRPRQGLRWQTFLPGAMK